MRTLYIILTALAAICVIAVVVIIGINHCGGGHGHASRGGNCCCCSGSGTAGTTSSSSASAFGSFGQPTTFINTSSLTDAPNGNVTFSIDPATHPTGGGVSYPQTITFTVAGASTSTFNPRVRLWQVDMATGTKIEPPITTFPGGSYTIGAFSGEARKYTIEVYKKLNPSPTTFFDTRVNFYADIAPGEVEVTYTCPEGSALLKIDD